MVVNSVSGRRQGNSGRTVDNDGRRQGSSGRILANGTIIRRRGTLRPVQRVPRGERHRQVR